MGAVRAFLVGLALLAASPARAHPSDVRIARWRPLIVEAAARFGIPEQWIARVMRAESGGRTLLDGRPITSHAGAMGLMQLMPRTFAEMRAAHGLGYDPHDPRDNILAGAAYLQLMHDRFGYPGLFAAYNAGPGRYAEHLTSGRALPGETTVYLAAVAAGKTEAPVGETPLDGLFFTTNASSRAPAAKLQSLPASAVFVVRKPVPASAE